MKREEKLKLSPQRYEVLIEIFLNLLNTNALLSKVCNQFLLETLNKPNHLK